jgi:hypothetical protein
MEYRTPKPLLSERLEQLAPIIFGVVFSGVIIYGAISLRQPELLMPFVLGLFALLMHKFAGRFSGVVFSALLIGCFAWLIFQGGHASVTDNINRYWMAGLLLASFLPHKWFPRAVFGYMVIVIGTQIWAQNLLPDNWAGYMMENWGKSLTILVCLAMLAFSFMKPKKGITTSDI